MFFFFHLQIERAEFKHTINSFRLQRFFRVLLSWNMLWCLFSALVFAQIDIGGVSHNNLCHNLVHF